MNISYECSICKRQKVKLWRPYTDSGPLICASCAEKKQSPKMYIEKEWIWREGKYVGVPTGNYLPLPKWKVDENGKVPSYEGPGPKTLPMPMSDQLIVNLDGVSTYNSSKETIMVPAILDEDNDFWKYPSYPEEAIRSWNDLPTR